MQGIMHLVYPPNFAYPMTWISVGTDCNTSPGEIGNNGYAKFLGCIMVYVKIVNCKKKKLMPSFDST